MSSASCKATENMGDREDDCDQGNKDNFSDEDLDNQQAQMHIIKRLSMLNRLRQSSSKKNDNTPDIKGTFQSARFPLPSRESADVMQTSFTEGDPLNRSTTGGGLDQEIKQIKSLLGLVA